ncbi:MAG: InlB B-repeat-containing protein [Oscillospiraceae bacterium]|nr:InlB B-repeat-containing protein [Oscillospiraceae bacterium]
MKRLFCSLLSLSLLFTLCICVHAAEIDGGKLGEDIVWSLDSAGRLSITGKGAIPDYGKGTQPWAAYQNSETNYIKTLVIGEGITRIGDRTMQNCKKLESADIPSSVKSIGSYAFQNCYLLESVELAPSVKLAAGTFRSAPAEADILAYQETSYTGSDYHKALAAVTLTGDYRKDIVAVALSQLGYHEGASEADFNGKHPESKEDYTEFGRFAGSAGSAWCSEFYNWCARMAGVPTDILNVARSAIVNNWLKGTNGKYYLWSETIYGGGSYEPQPGDLLQWVNDLDEHAADEELAHTSMFNGATDNGDGTVTVHSIDGNWSSKVRTRDIKLDKETGASSYPRRIFYVVSPDFNQKVTKYTVSFVCEGASYPSKTVAENGYYGALPLPERDGRKFLGWYTEKTGGKLVNMYTPVKLSGDQTLYARWEGAPMAKQSSETVTLNGSKVTLPTFQLFDANGGGTNYVRLRDVAALLDGTAAQFDVQWNGKVVIAPKSVYASRNGTEGTSPFSGDQPYAKLGDSVLVGDAEKTLEGIVLTDATGGGHTYFKLRDLGAACGFTVDWDQAVGIIINT